MRCKDCRKRLVRPSARVIATGRCSACRGESRRPDFVSVTPDEIEAELRRQGFTPQDR